MIRFLSLFVATLFISACTTGQLYYTDQSGHRVMGCDVEFVGLPSVDKFAVEYALSYCAKSVVSKGHQLDDDDQYLLTLDTSIPEAPCGRAWDHDLAEAQYDEGLISAREYGYIVAHIDMGLVLPVLACADSGFVKVKGYELEYEIAGNGSEIVLLEAGGSAGMSDWDSVFKKISEHAKVIRYSRVGNGNSTAIKQHFTSRDYADHASALLTEIGIQQPVIYVAHSYGGSVARDFAAAYPEQIKALMMLDPSSEHDVDILRAIDLEKGNQEIAQIKLADMAGEMSNQYLDFWSKRPLPDYPQIKDMPLTVIASVRKMDNPPNLFFTDSGRQMWGELWQQWASAFPQGKAVLTENSGHFVQVDEPELVVNELLVLMQKLEE